MVKIPMSIVRKSALIKMFSLGFVGGRHSCLCIQKHGISGEPSTEWASLLIQKTLAIALNCIPPTSHQLLQQSTSAIMLWEPVLRGRTVTAVNKSQFKTSKTFDSIYEFYVQEAHVADTAWSLGLCGLVQSVVK